MKNTVHKWVLHMGNNNFSMPVGAKILSVREQYGEPVLYAQVSELNSSSEVRKFILVGTGHTFDSTNCVFIDTVMLLGGQLVNARF